MNAFECLWKVYEYVFVFACGVYWTVCNFVYIFTHGHSSNTHSIGIQCWGVKIFWDIIILSPLSISCAECVQYFSYKNIKFRNENVKIINNKIYVKKTTHQHEYEPERVDRSEIVCVSIENFHTHTKFQLHCMCIHLHGCEVFYPIHLSHSLSLCLCPFFFRKLAYALCDSLTNISFKLSKIEMMILDYLFVFRWWNELICVSSSSLARMHELLFIVCLSA